MYTDFYQSNLTLKMIKSKELHLKKKSVLEVSPFKSLSIIGGSMVDLVDRHSELDFQVIASARVVEGCHTYR